MSANCCSARHPYRAAECRLLADHSGYHRATFECWDDSPEQALTSAVALLDACGDNRIRDAATASRKAEREERAARVQGRLADARRLLRFAVTCNGCGVVALERNDDGDCNTCARRKVEEAERRVTLRPPRKPA